jgi:vancomycin resistance protein YoaR
MGLGAIVVIVVRAILGDSLLYYNKIHAGVTVAGQQVSGLTPEEAAARLSGMVDEVQQDSITLTYEGKSWEVFADDLGVTMDVEGAVAAAMGVSRDGNIFADLGKRLKLYFSDVDVPLVGKMDDQQADATLAKIAAEIDVAPVNASLSMENGQIKAIDDQPGRAVDTEALREELRGIATTLHSTEVAIPVKVVEAAVRADDTAEALAQAKTMIGSPITLTSGDKKWTISTQQIASYISSPVKNRNGVSTLVPVLDAAKMEAFLATLADEVATKPVDATFQSDGKKAWVVPGVPGKAIDPAGTAKAITDASLKTTGRTVEVVVKTTDPERTTEEAEAMGIKDLLATYSDSYGGSANRQHNVRITPSTPATCSWLQVRSTTSTNRSGPAPPPAATRPLPVSWAPASWRTSSAAAYARSRRRSSTRSSSPAWRSSSARTTRSTSITIPRDATPP